MSAQEELNPYAPPLTELRAPQVPTPVGMKRPASVKWAVALAAIIAGFFLLGLGNAIVDGRVASIIQRYVNTPWNVSRLIPILLAFALVGAGRQRLGYWAGMALLALLCGFTVVFVVRREVPLKFSEAVGAWIGSALLIGLPFWLFIRFTFGRPSRLYYRVAKELHRSG